MNGLQERIIDLRSEVARMHSTIYRMEQEKFPRRRAPIVTLVGWIASVAVFASWGLAQERLEGRHMHAPFAVVDSDNEVIFLVKDESLPANEKRPGMDVGGTWSKGRGAYLIDEDKVVVSMSAHAASGGAGGLVRVVSAEDESTYAVLGAIPDALAFGAVRAGKPKVHAGQTEDGNVVNVYADSSNGPLAQIASISEFGQVSVYNAAEKKIAGLQNSSLGGGAVFATDAAGNTKFWAKGSPTGGDVCVTRPKGGESCVRPQVSIAN